MRLENVEARHRPGLKPILLILELTLKQLDRFFLHTDERAIEQHLIKLLAHRGHNYVDCISKRVVAAVAREIRGANLRNDPTTGEEHLCRLDLHIV